MRFLFCFKLIIIYILFSIQAGAKELGYVKLSYDIDKKGNVVNVEVIDSNPKGVYEEAAIRDHIAHKREPKYIDGEAVFQRGLTATITQNTGKPDGYVLLSFDINEKGHTENIKILETSSKSYNKAAINSLSKWKYNPKVVNGVPVKKLGLTVKLDFRIQV